MKYKELRDKLNAMTEAELNCTVQVANVEQNHWGELDGLISPLSDGFDLNKIDGEFYLG